jgi:hypothetical protein
MDVQAATFPTNITILVVGMILWGLATTRIIFGVRALVDKNSGIQVPWVQIGWNAFAWAFLFASFWPIIDVLLQETWVLSDLVFVTVGGLLLFFAAAAIAPDGTYKEAGGEARYLEVAPIFFGLFAAYQVWLVISDNIYAGGADSVRIGLSIGAIIFSLVLVFTKNMTVQKIVSVLAWILAGLIVILQANEVIVGALVRPEELAPLQGGIAAIWLGCMLISIVAMVLLTMAPIVNRYSGFRPYSTHTAWALWFFFWALLIWWRSPTLATPGWQYIHFLFITIGPVITILAWMFLMPQGTDGDAEAAKAQYFEKAPQGFRLMALLAVWAIVFNLWLIGGTTAIVASIGWGVGLAIFIALTRSSNPRLHGGAVAFAWILLVTEYVFELARGVPAL